MSRLRAAYRALTLDQVPELRAMLGIEGSGPGGVAVTERTSLQCSAFFNGVWLISSQVGLLPRVLYRRLAGEERERARNLPLYSLLESSPNPYQNASVFWQTFAFNVLIWGNAYAEIEWDNAGRARALWLLPPWQVAPTVVRSADAQGRPVSRLVYKYTPTPGRKPIDFEAWELLHVPGLGFDGIKGESVLAYARNSLGLSLAVEQYGGLVFTNDASVGVVLEHPGQLGEKARENLRKSFTEATSARRAHSLMVLEENMKANRIGIPPEDAQMLETRGHQVVEVARWLNIPPHKLKDLGRATWANIGALQVEFLQDTLAPWLVRIEEELTRKLIGSSAYFVEHLVDAVLRGDPETRSKIYSAYFGVGAMGANDIARRENLPPAGPAGDTRFRPANMIPLDQVAPATATPSRSSANIGEDPTALAAARELERATRDLAARELSGPPLGGAARIERAARGLAIAGVGRFMRREAAAARRAAKRGPELFGAWLDELVGEDERAVLAELLAPVVDLRLAIAGRDDQAGAAAIAADLARDYVEASRAAFEDVPAAGLEAGVDALLERWKTARALELVDRLTETPF